MDDYKGIIKNITKNTWVKEEYKEHIKHCRKKEDALLFYDENDAVSTVEMLNDIYPDCYTLIDLPIKLKSN